MKFYCFLFLLFFYVLSIFHMFTAIILPNFKSFLTFLHFMFFEKVTIFGENTSNTTS